MQPRAFLFDLDGTLFTSHGVIPGAPELLADLRRRGIPFRLLTNTTMRSRAQLLEHIASLGLEASQGELFTPSVAAAAALDAERVRSVAPFVPEAVLADLGDRSFVGGLSGNAAAKRPDAVVLGDLGTRWDATLLNEAFRYVLEGSLFVALQKGRYWLSKEGPLMDAGAFVAAVEYAARTEAIVCGKPERPFFRAALESLFVAGVDADAPIAMVGDDMWNDVHGAQRAGLEGWLVRTGKYSEPALRRSDVVPDRVLDSVADLLEGRG